MISIPKDVIEEFNQERLDEKSENNQDEDLESMNN